MNHKHGQLIRNLWASATELAKTALDAKSAMEAVSQMTSKLKGLETLILDGECVSEEKWQELGDVSEVIALLTAQGTEALSEEDAGKLASLMEAKESLTQHCPPASVSMSCIVGFLDKQWLEGCKTSELALGHQSKEDLIKMFHSCVNSGPMMGWRVES